MSQFKIQMFKNKRKQWLFRIRSAKNGRIMCHSESYSSKTSCSRSVKALLEGLCEDVPVEEVEYDG